MNTPLYYFYHAARRTYHNIPEEERMEAPDLKRRVVKSDDVKPSGDDVKPDPEGEKAMKNAMKGSDDVKADGNTPKNKDEAIKHLSNQLSDGKIDLDAAIKEVRSL